MHSRTTPTTGHHDPFSKLQSYSEEELDAVMDLIGEAERLKHDPQARLVYPDVDEVAMTFERFMEAMVQKLPPEKRLSGLSLEERLAGLSPEEIVADLSLEQREGLIEILQRKLNK